MRVCPECGDLWVSLAGEECYVCPTCRLPGPQVKLSRRVGGKLPSEPAEAKQAPPPSLEEA